MAYTEIHPITATVHKAIAYICNPEKTDGKLLISSFGCAPETAHFDFAFTSQSAAIQSPNLAHHLIQSFKPGEVSPEEAHQIGQEMADRLLKGKYSYVLSTHIDKGHVHNHIIFNAVDHEEYKHYDDCKKSYYHIRGLSDGLCREHDLSVIEEQSGKRGKSWWEYQKDKDGDSWKTQLKRDINKCIKITDSFEEFLEFMKAKGYQIKLGKYISFCAPGQEKFIRGKENILGKQYTKEKIQERIHNSRSKPGTRITVIRLQYLLEIPVEELQKSENAGLRRWATKENLKRMAETYNQMIENGIGSVDELSAKMDNLKEQRRELRKSLKDMEQQHKNLTEMGKYLKQYQDTREIYQGYKNAYLKDRYFRKHESEIIVHGAAVNYFKHQGIKLRDLDENAIQSRFGKLNMDMERLKKEMKALEKKSQSFEKINHNLRHYLDMTEPDKVREGPTIEEDIRK